MSVVVSGRSIPMRTAALDGTSVSVVGLERAQIERHLNAGADGVVFVSTPDDRGEPLDQMGLQLLESAQARVVMVVHTSGPPSVADVARWCEGIARFGASEPAVRVSLASGAVAPADVRRAVADYVWLACAGEVVTTAPLAASELVSNALQHVGDGRFELGVEDGEVSLAVFDSQPLCWPGLRPADPLADAGRGMAIIAAVAYSWGITAGREEKAVWCELR